MMPGVLHWSNYCHRKRAGQQVAHNIGRIRRSQSAAPALMLAPALLLFGAFVVLPILASIRLGFYEWDGISEARFIGLDNYREMWADPVFWVSLRNNLIWLAGFLCAPVFGLALALFLNQQWPGMRLIKTLFFFPFVLSQVVVGLVFAWFYEPAFGLLNQLLALLHIGQIAPLANENWVTPAIVLAGLWPQVAYCMMLYLTGLNHLNHELIEAARLDGARGWHMFRHIVWPQLRPASSLVMIVTLIGALRSFDLVALMSHGGPFNSSNVLGFYMYQHAAAGYRIGYGAALATVLLVIMDGCTACFLYNWLKQQD
jgi:multiple sugar transport system permease protein